MRSFDLVALTEVVAGPGGAQAVARLADELNRLGSKWDYCVSDPTTGKRGSERYAFLWKTSVLKKLGDGSLEKKYADSIEREPYSVKFLHGKEPFTVSVFHAVPKNKQPEKELKFLKNILAEHPGETLLFCGDFNCAASNEVFQTLKQQNYAAALQKQKTTLRMGCVNNQCLASEYDNIFYPYTRVNIVNSGVLHFYQHYPNVKQARQISDHLPVFAEFNIR